MKDRSLPLDFSLALHTGEDRESVLSNRKRLRGYFGTKCSFVGTTQVHGKDVYIAENDNTIDWLEMDGNTEADALFTDRPNVVLTVLTADCVPILLYDPCRRVIGAVHAGWRGSRENIAGLCIDKMVCRYGSSPTDIIVAIGPSIRQCCYEVDYETAQNFFSFSDCIQKHGSRKYMLNLKKINQVQLKRAGVPISNITDSGICTACENRRFFSYRGEKECTGRFASCIMLTWS